MRLSIVVYGRDDIDFSHSVMSTVCRVSPIYQIYL